ncbi:ADP-ribosylglycohydrolase [Deinococcus metalli]|uniref:ADP-ribosylglycohydrolase n=2 Tax=Deinococcus metalli TaxID=1141878 RepID=A0A7W8KI31_9DEIO|nr:ADP-ribosylglycohydrolase family protein [Deinococcus metalli]MBB5378550.1 ADP-ribosylglycohydrolase [Deinococcus metalli]
MTQAFSASPVNRANRIRGCLIGGAIGDAWGSTFENRTAPPEVELPWAFTDDTQFTLATCEAILAAEAVRPDGLAQAFVRWYQARQFTGVGSSTLKALRDLEAGAHWALSGARGERAAGNGAAIRIAPLAFLLDPNDLKERQVIRDVCRIMHHHEEAYVGALAVIYAIQAVVTRPLGWDVLGIGEKLPDSRVRDQLRSLTTQQDMSIEQAAERFGSSGFVGESVPLAVFAAAQEARLGFQGVMEAIMRAGGDTDTVGSMAGQLMGAAIGSSALPEALVSRLPHWEMLSVADRFASWAASLSRF